MKPVPLVDAGGDSPLHRAADGFLLGLDIERGAATNTLLAYARDLRQYLDFLVDLSVHAPAAVTRTHVRSFLLQRAEQGLQARSRARLLSALRGFHRYCCESGAATADRSETNPARRARTSLRARAETTSAVDVVVLVVAVMRAAPRW